MTNKPCAFDGCDKTAIARGVCAGHYQQYRHGKELTPLRVYSKEEIVERQAAMERHPLFQDAK